MLKKRILESIQQLFSDTSQPAESTAAELLEIQQTISELLDSLREDGVDF